MTPEEFGYRVNMDRAQSRATGLRGLANAETEAQLAALQADQAVAARASRTAGNQMTNIAGARAINEALPGQAARLGLAGLAGNAAQQVGEPPAAAPAPLTGVGPGDPGWGKDLGQQIVPADLSKDEKKEVVAAAKQAVPDKKGTKDWTSDDWLTLGLNLMATKSSNFMQAVGNAGIATLKSRQERAKEARETAADESLAEYRKAMTAQANAQAAELTSGNSKTKQALAAADAMYDNWLNTVKANPLEAMNITPEMASQKRQQYLREAFAGYNIPLPAALASSAASPVDTAGFKLLGSRPAQ
jgi:hypothetical protein